MTITNQQVALQLAARHLAQAQEQTAVAMRGDNVHERRFLSEKLLPLHDTLNALGTALEAAGATPPPLEGYQGTPPPSPDSLEHLKRIEESRKEAQELIHHLVYALRAAEVLDRARGDWVGDMADTAHGETPGTNYAEAVQELLLKLQGDLGIGMGGGRE
jgi:hypothetical protein